MRAVALAAVVGFAGLALGEQIAEAQVSQIATPAVDLERFWLEPGPGAVLAASDAEVLAPGAMHVAVSGSLMSRPIVLAELQGGAERSVPVSLRLGYEVAVARGITERLQLGFALPVVAAQEGERFQGIGLSEISLDPVTLGDVRLHAKLRLSERPGSRLRYGVAMHLRLPTGNEEHFAGEAGPVVAWGFTVGYTWRALRLVGNAGLRIRTEEVAIISPARAHSNELVALAGAEYRLPQAPIGLLAEYAHVRGDGLGPSPAEARAGLAAYVLPRATLKAAFARGVTSGEVGSPDWRVVATFEYEGR